MTNCSLYQDDLKAYRDSELPPLRRWAVRRHLTHCASCRKEIQAMTQLTEDLRATEPEDALSPTLREKLLAEPTPAQVPTLPKREGEEFQDDPSLKTLRPPVSGGPLRSKEVGSKKRRLHAWTYAALAVVAWFVCFPLFQKARENSLQAAHFSRVVAAQTTGSTAHYAPKAPQMPLPQSQSANEHATSARAVPMPIKALPMPDVPAPPAMPMSVPPPKPMPMAGLRSSDSVVGQTYAPSGPRFVPSPPNSSTADTLNGDPDSLRQVHKEAGIGLQVPNPDATGDKLNDMVKETGGYVAANNLSTEPDGTKSGELIVKVPEAQFETFLAAVAKLGVVVSKNITGQDITEQTSDAHEAQSVEASDLAQAEARLKSLGKHATWEDKEDTQDERVKLAETRARLKLLKRMAALGTITVDLSETPKGAVAPPVTSGFTGTLKATTQDALQSLVGSAAALLALVIWLLAYAPIWVPLLLLGRYALKEYKKREVVSNP